MRTGESKPISKAFPQELQAQELSCLDEERAIYYFVGFNYSSKSPNLVGINVNTGHTMVNEPLPLTESVFVGIGQTIDVDPRTGDILLVGRSNKVNASNPLHMVARLLRLTGFRQHEVLGYLDGLDVLGGSSALDIDRRVLYVGVIASGTPPAISINIHEFNIDTGKTRVIYTNASTGHVINDMSYDHELKRIYGFGVDMTTKKRSLVYIDPSSGAWHQVGDVGTGHPSYTTEDGNLVTLDWTKREFYSLLAVKANVTTFKPSNKCNKTECPRTNTSQCCYDPKDGPDRFACYRVPDCSRISDNPPFNISAPFYLVASDLDNGMTLPTARPPICSLSDGDCPWSMEFSNKL